MDWKDRPAVWYQMTSACKDCGARVVAPIGIEVPEKLAVSTFLKLGEHGTALVCKECGGRVAFPATADGWQLCEAPEGGPVLADVSRLARSKR